MQWRNVRSTLLELGKLHGKNFTIHIMADSDGTTTATIKYTRDRGGIELLKWCDTCRSTESEAIKEVLRMALEGTE